MSLSHEEVERLRRLYPLLEALYNILGEFLGKKPIPPAPARPRAEIRRITIAPETAPKVSAPPAARVPIQLFKPIPYSEHLFTKVAQPIDDKERVFDLGGVWEAIIVYPEIDAYIEFDKKITDVTPMVPGGTTFNAEMYVREVHYKSAVTGLTGDLYVWAFR